MTQSLIHIINCKIKELDFYIVCIDSKIIKNSCLSKSSFLGPGISKESTTPTSQLIVLVGIVTNVETTKTMPKPLWCMFMKLLIRLRRSQ